MLTDALSNFSYPFWYHCYLATLDVDETVQFAERPSSFGGVNDVPFFLQNGLNKEYIGE